MKINNVLRFSAILLAFAFFVACKSDPSSGENSSDAAGKATPADVPADASNVENTPPFTQEQLTESHLKLLAGKWRSASDYNYVVEFAGNKMRHITNGVLTDEGELSVDMKCAAAPCITGGEKPLGWCLLEKTRGGEQCHVVTSANAVEVVFRTVGAAGGDMKFGKVK